MALIFQPDAVTEISGQSLTAAEAGLRALSVTLALGCHGRAELHLWPRSLFSDAAPGDALTLALGPRGDTRAVLTGTVSALRRETDRLVIEALDLSAPLARARRALTFEETPVGDIVRKIAEDASLSVDADADDTLAIYYVEPARPLWDHLRALSALTGRDLALDPEGTLLFRKPEAGTTHSLRFGADLIDWTIAPGEGPAPVARAAHGAKSESGNRAWINPDPLGEEPGLARIEGVLTDRDLAATATAAAETRAARAALRGRLLVMGDPAIRPADIAELSGLPDGSDPGPLRIRSVHHRLDGARGFTTELEVEAGGTSGGLLGGLL